MAEFIHLEKDKTTGVATIRLERPPMNAISMQLAQELGEAAEELSGSQEIGAAVIWGGPKIFAAGADIKEFPAIQDKPEAIEFSLHLHKARTMTRVWRKMASWKAPCSIASVIYLCHPYVSI